MPSAQEGPVPITVVNPSFKDVQWLSDHARGQGMVVRCYADTSVSPGVRPRWREHLKNEVKRIDEPVPKRHRAAGELWGKQQATIARHHGDRVLHYLKELAREIERAWPAGRHRSDRKRSDRVRRLCCHGVGQRGGRIVVHRLPQVVRKAC